MTPFSTWYQKSQKYQMVLMGLRNLRRRDGGGKGEAPPRFKSVPKVPKPFKVGRDRFGTDLLLYCYGFHKRKEASMNQDKDQDRDCPTCIHHVADWRLCLREDQEKIGVWTEPDGPCPGWEPKGGEDGRP